MSLPQEPTPAQHNNARGKQGVAQPMANRVSYYSIYVSTTDPEHVNAL